MTPDQRARIVAESPLHGPALLAELDGLREALVEGEKAITYIRVDLVFCAADGGIHVAEIMTADRALGKITAALSATDPANV